MAVAIEWSRFWEQVRQAKKIVLTSHVRPDGDSLGSQTAMADAILSLDGERNVMMINSDPVPPPMRFLDPDQRIRPLDDLNEEERAFLGNADLMISLDTCSKAQLGKMFDYFNTLPAKKLIVDHHIQHDDFEAEHFADPDSPATGQLVYDALRAGNIPFTKRIAFEIFVAMATDTGWFRFASVTPHTFETVADLMREGVRIDDVYRIIYEQETLGRIRLSGIALAKTEALLDGTLMFTSLLLSDFENAGAHKSESEDIVNQTLAVGGAKMAIIMVEQEGGAFKISFRSRCHVDCAVLAKTFGGGGHKAAAGARIEAPYEEARRMLIEKTTEMIRGCP